jgi:hypothetical protein
VRTAWARAAVRLPPDAALALWTDVQRWPTFVEGFGHVVELSPEWPAVGARVVWESTPGGRGRVTEKVVESEGDGFATRVFESALVGTQTLRLAGGEVELTLEYELQRYGPLRAPADALFIRRALRDALRRTLARFAVESEEEAGLR